MDNQTDRTTNEAASSANPTGDTGNRTPDLAVANETTTPPESPATPLSTMPGSAGDTDASITLPDKIATDTDVPTVTPSGLDQEPVPSGLVVPPVPSTRRRLVKQYGWMLLALLVMGLILWYGLERQGRIDTGVFDRLAAFVNPEPAVAVVNRERVTMSEYERNRQQLNLQATQQGLNPADEATAAQIKENAITTLINTKLLRQAALEAGFRVTPEQIEERYQDVLTQVGSTEELAARMAEIGIDEKTLREDIEGEILIQSFLEEKIDAESVVVTEEEVRAVYDSANTGERELPPFEDVRAQIESNLRYEKWQGLVDAYIEELRADATIEVLI